MSDVNLSSNASLSTMWAISNYSDLNDFIRLAKQMGFQKIELNHQVDSNMLADVDWTLIQVSSVHEPCPSDISMKDLANRDWLISSSMEDSRRRGVERVKRSIKLASDLGAPVVIIHAGNVAGGLEFEPVMRSLFTTGMVQSEEFRNIRSRFISKRAELAPPRFQAVKHSLVELLEFAQSLNVKLGLENRYHYGEIPLIDEMEELLSLGEPDQLGFIYDIGHAHSLDQLGFYPQEEWLTHFSHRIIGVHLHDVLGLVDHYAPGLGNYDFKSIAHYLPQGAFRTFEVLPGNKAEDIARGVRLLVEQGCINYL